MRWEIRTLKEQKTRKEEKGIRIDKIQYCFKPSRDFSLLWSFESRFGFGFGFIRLQACYTLTALWLACCYWCSMRTYVIDGRRYGVVRYPCFLYIFGSPSLDRATELGLGTLEYIVGPGTIFPRSGIGWRYIESQCSKTLKSLRSRHCHILCW